MLDFELSYTPASMGLRAAVGWGNLGAYQEIPVDSVNKGVPFDSLRYQGARLLQTATLGGITYGPTLQIAPAFFGFIPAKGALRRLYYAKGFGIVGFVEGTTLWYRLP